jgi:putative transposase
MNERRGAKALRRARFSVRGGTYFLTLCTNDRAQGLNTPAVVSRIKDELSSAEFLEIIQCHAGVIMSDHLHLLISLFSKLRLSQFVARLKVKTSDHLKIHGLTWQSNFYEHHLRPDDQVEEVIRYIYLNPFRAKLIPCSPSAAMSYPHFWLGAEEAEWFRPTLAESSTPFPEWLQ